MEFKDICARKEYDTNGQKKVVWLKVGTLKTASTGKQYIELNMIPNESYFVFESKEKKQGDWNEA